MTSKRLLTPLLMATMAALLLVPLPACTPKKPSTAMQISSDATWSVFRKLYCQSPKAPGVLIKASLYYSRVKPTKRNNRTVVSMWGDFSGPMRLDISAGIGKLLAHIRENDDGLLVFYPSSRRAYSHVNPVLGATRLGIPFPFSMNELASLIMGDFSGLIPVRYDRARRDKTNFVYLLDNGLVTSVTLDQTGRPILLEGRTTNAYETAQTWRLEINTYEENGVKTAPLPGRLTLALDNGEKGVLRIKSRQLKLVAWPARSTGLTLPEGTETIRLDKRPEPAANGDIPVVYEDKS